MLFLSILHLGISRTTCYGWLFHYLRLKYYYIIFKEFNVHKTRNTKYEVIEWFSYSKRLSFTSFVGLFLLNLKI